MASSSDNEHHRSQQRPKPLARQNSSFIGTIKNIVRAPLNWFANQDEHAATPGKRRRPLEQQATEELDGEDDSELEHPGPPSAMEPDSDEEGTRSSKRIRLHSPPRQHYLDPPMASLRRTAPPRRSSVIPRAASAMLPSSAGGRSTLSPRRQFSTTRTMSIDPPSRALSSHDSSAFNFGPPPSSAESDYEMAIDSNGNWSVPPSPRRSPRPSFRMRSSVTPQPQFTRPPMRYISEPPLLNSLVSNPAFVQTPRQTLAPLAETPTLGSLVESVKATKSPTKQQQTSSLFSSSQLSDGPEQKNAPSERVLSQLDVYKTPLLPSRMRTSDATEALTANRTPEMFASRRRKRLELMSEERERTAKRGAGEGKVTVTNETKPYAGDGALRKLLARRKQETTEEEQPKLEPETRSVDLSVKSNRILPTSIVNDVPPPPPLPVPTGPDFFAPTTNSSLEGGSSLRVGRTISSRKHIHRPSPLQRPSTSKFSAVYEEEGDDVMGDTAKVDSVPQLFAEPVGFSFAKDTAGPDHSAELENAKEPPLTSLPFSFAKPAVLEKPAPAPTPVSIPSSASDGKMSSTSTLFGPSSSQPSNLLNIPKPTTSQSTTTGIPNFFAKSTLIKETPMPVAPVLTFPAPSVTKTSSGPSQPSTGSDFFSLKPKSVDLTPKVDNDKDNPFWLGSSDKPADGDAKSFGGFGQTPSAKPVAEAPASGNSPSPLGFSAPSQTFSFDKPTQTNPSTSSAATNPFASGKSSGHVPNPFSFNTPNIDSKTSEVLAATATASSSASDKGDAPGSIFGEKKSDAATPSLFDNMKAAPQTGNLFGTPASASSAPSNSFKFDLTPDTSRAATPTFASSTTAPTSTQPNFFGTPANQAPSSDPPKPIFNPPSVNTSGFSFGQPPAAPVEKAGENKAFSFGTTTPSGEANKSSMFSFGQAASSSSTPIPPVVSNPAPAFSFSNGPGAAGSPSADVSNKQFFMFGQPSASASQRPVTPPKNNDNEFMMEESPTRDLQQANKAPEARPSLGGGAFSFGNQSISSDGSTLFGNTAGPSSNSSPFGFGTSAPSNPFAQKSTKPEEPPAFGGFAQSAAPVAPPIQTSFSFGQPAKSPEPQRPNTAGGFGGFGTTPTSATASTPAPFAFGASAPSSNPFGQPAGSTSAPSSPSTFNQSTPFSFGASTATPTGAFTFGSSQPASPASGGNLSLPPSGFGNTGGFGQSAQQPSSPFGAPALLAPSTSSGGGGGLFTIGAAPPQNTQAGARAMKKLPNRRGGVKR